jgi:peptidoglycan/xylan/chitin deacetylase (PgdA/CDA1 family)
MGTTAPTGEIFVADDLDALVAGGHEIGCHTYAHSDSWQTPPAEFGQSIARNAQVLERMLPGMSFRTFAYPISPPRPRSKRIATATFACCRGGGQRVNEGTADAGYLAAYFMEQARGDVRVLEAAVDRNSQVGGWLIFATHDVCEQPTPYGCTPGFFESVVRYAVQSGARVLPVVEAWASLVAASGGRDSRP